ncbi:MAG TPA: MBL fold metallo-hydrolase [Anaerolineales bacterium]|nr:MBL fold metallo-hydrolase [Anaerolineales bacterium]
MFTRIADQVFLFHDTCNVYILCSGREALLIDFGNGDVLDHLTEIGVERVTDVLMTHHHRDQGQGLARAVQTGICIWVPRAEQDLFHNMDMHWQTREVFNNYNVRQDRFSLLEPVPVAGTLDDYEVRRFGDHSLTVLPTPGHTPGSISLLVEIDGRRLLFSGDLIAAPGKVFSLSATQWTYGGSEGVAASIASLLDLQDRQLDLLLPSHGEPIKNPQLAMALLVERFWELLQGRKEHLRLRELRQHPYRPVLAVGEGVEGQGTPHLLMNRTSVANTYVLLSASKKALFIDFGYDFITGFSAGRDRASRRPWLYTLPALKAQFGVNKIDVVLPTHYHDDHVAGCNLLRCMEGTQVWAAENFADILEHPAHYDLPCLWFDSIPVHRRLPLGQPIAWEEYTLTLHPLPGHTRYAVAIELEVDGLRFLATGDQFHGEDGLGWNYVYQNGYGIGDYTAAASLYKRICPDYILSGHWQPLRVTPAYLEKIAADAETLDRLHRELLPETPDLGAEGFVARIMPYQVDAAAGEIISFEVEIRNPFPCPKDALIQLITPTGWVVEGSVQIVRISDVHRLSFKVTPADVAIRRARLAVDLTIDGQRFGQQAEALVTVVPRIDLWLPPQTSSWHSDVPSNTSSAWSPVTTNGLYYKPDTY